MSKMPAFQFYPADWRKDPGVQSLSFHDRGVWFEILCLMHESEQRGKLMIGGRPMPDSALARLLGLDKQNLTTTLTTLLDFGVASRDEESGALVSRRMVRDEILRKIRKDAGKKGGNPRLVNQNPTTPVNQNPTTHLKQNPTPSSSSSPSGILERDIDAGAEVRRPSLEQALSAAAQIGVTPEMADEWWNAREGSEWMKGTGGGGTTPVGSNWRADLKTYASRMASSVRPASKQQPQQRKLEWE